MKYYKAIEELIYIKNFFTKYDELHIELKY